MMRTLVTVAIFGAALFGQANVIDLPRAPLGDGPFIFDTAEQHKIKVTVITKALDRPFGIAFLPGGNILVSERGPGKLLIVRDGVLDPQPIAGVPKVNSVRTPASMILFYIPITLRIGGSISPSASPLKRICLRPFSLESSCEATRSPRRRNSTAQSREPTSAVPVWPSPTTADPHDHTCRRRG